MAIKVKSERAKLKKPEQPKAKAPERSCPDCGESMTCIEREGESPVCLAPVEKWGCYSCDLGYDYRLLWADGYDWRAAGHESDGVIVAHFYYCDGAFSGYVDPLVQHLFEHPEDGVARSRFDRRNQIAQRMADFLEEDDFFVVVENLMELQDFYLKHRETLEPASYGA